MYAIPTTFIFSLVKRKEKRSASKKVSLHKIVIIKSLLFKLCVVLDLIYFYY